MPRRSIALAAGEAMRKQRHRADRAIRPVEQRRERVALGVLEVEFFGGHDPLVSVTRRATFFLRLARTRAAHPRCAATIEITAARARKHRCSMDCRAKPGNDARVKPDQDSASPS